MNRWTETTCRVAVVCGLGGGLVSAARADVAFSNLGTGDSYSGNGYILYGPGQGSWTQGFRFVAGASGGITNLVVPVQQNGGTVDVYTFELYTDTPTGPGTTLGVVGQTHGALGSGPPWPAPNQIACG